MFLIRVFIFTILFWTVYRYAYKLYRSLAPDRRETISEGHAPDGALFRGDMVRDEVCKAFVVKERALSLSTGGNVRYFCSDACRKKYLEGSGGR